MTIDISKTFITLTSSIAIYGCTSVNRPQISSTKPAIAQNNAAKVTEVAVTGEPNNYTFAVTVSSPDTGCVAKPCL